MFDILFGLSRVLLSGRLLDCLARLLARLALDLEIDNLVRLPSGA